MSRAAASVMTPDLDGDADSINASVDPRLSERLVVTSRFTAVDTEQLVCAATTAVEVFNKLGQAHEVLENASRDASFNKNLAPQATAVACSALQTTCDQVLSAQHALQQWVDGLSYAALVYAGAEGNAQAFKRIWKLTGSGPYSIWGGAWEGPGAAAGATWDTGLFSVHSEARDVMTRAEMMQMVVTRGVLAPFIVTHRAFRIGKAGLPVILEFMGRKASDASLLFRAQMGMNDASDMFSFKRLFLARPDIGPECTQTWWGETHGGTAPVALEAALYTEMGLGMIKGFIPGLSVTSTLPSDTLDPRTGKPVEPMYLDQRVGANAQAFSAQQGASPPRPPKATATPVLASALLGRIGRLDSTSDHGQFEILRHQTGQKTSWSVVIRGTQVWGVGERNPQDMLTNLQGVATMKSDQVIAIKEAMKTVGIKAGDAVEITGHSQGGIVAGQLATDSEVQEKYRVVSVLTAGSPTGNTHVPASTHMLNLESSRDIVPALDGMANMDLDHSATVTFDGGMVKTEAQENSNAKGHDLSGYEAVMQWMEQHPSHATQEVAGWSQYRLKELGLEEDTQTTSYLFNTARLYEE